MPMVKRPLPSDMSWVLEPLLALPGVRHGVMLTCDGMVAGSSPELSREAGEGAAAMMSALQGAARALVQEISCEPGAEVEQIVIATNGGFAFAVQVGPNTILALYADVGADIEAVSHQVQIQMRLLGGMTNAHARGGRASRS